MCKDSYMLKFEVPLHPSQRRGKNGNYEKPITKHVKCYNLSLKTDF